MIWALPGGSWGTIWALITRGQLGDDLGITRGQLGDDLGINYQGAAGG